SPRSGARDPKPQSSPYSGQLLSTSLHPSCTRISRYLLLLMWSLKMIRSCLRELTRRNIAQALLGITSIFLSGCGGLGHASTAPPPDPQLNQSINHIIFLVQENRGFDHYFGHLPDYWAANGYPAVQFDAEPANASNPTPDGTGTINAYHFRTV